MAGVKIVDLPALGRDLINTDLLEVSLNGGGSRKITGQEIMNASKLAIGSTPIVAGTVGRLLFQGTGNVLQQSGNLFWDNPNLRLGIGISTPLYTLDVAGNIHGNSIFAEYNIVSSAGNVWLSNGYAIGDYGTGNNRIEFYSNRLSFFGNGNEALRIVGSTGNLLVNTTTDAGFKLDVNGTARVTNNLNVGTSAISGTQVVINGGQSLVATTDFYLLHLFGFNTSGSAGVGSKQWITFGINDAARSSKIGGINLGNNNYESGLVFNTTTGGNNLERLRILNNGNVLINTTTDDGFKLDVNGTARVSSNISGIYDGLNVRNSAGASNAQARIKFDNDITPTQTTTGGVVFYTSSVFSGFPSSSFGLWNYNSNGVIAFATNSTERLRIFSTGNVGINTTTDAGIRLDVNGTARVSSTLAVGGPLQTGGSGFGNTMLSIQSSYPCFILSSLSGTPSKVGFNLDSSKLYFSEETNNTTAYGHRLMADTKLGGLVVLNNTATGSVASLNASAVLQADSTTRGFLPPRMTNAQRAAIASPAVGLIVYCTDATEGLYVYKSTGWTFMV